MPSPSPSMLHVPDLFSLGRSRSTGSSGASTPKRISFIEPESYSSSKPEGSSSKFLATKTRSKPKSKSKSSLKDGDRGRDPTAKGKGKAKDHGSDSEADRFGWWTSWLLGAAGTEGGSGLGLGVGVGRAYRFTAPSTGICLVYKTKTKPWSIEGGAVGDNNHVVLNPGTDREVVQGGSYNHLETGDVLVNNTGGGGGYGDPFEREPGRVAVDVRNGFVSVGAAERDYGVVVDPATFVVDDTRTAALRAAR